MFTRPADLDDEDVGTALRAGWGLDVAHLEHAPVGFGSHHWWVTTRDGRRWFATADDLRTRRAFADEALEAPLARLRAALGAAACLAGDGLNWVVAPRPSRSGDAVLRVSTAYAVAVYPRAEGRTFGWGPYEDPGHRAAVLDHLVALHTCVGCRGVADVDDLGRALVARLRALLADPAPMWDAGPFAAPAWRLVVEGSTRLAGMLDHHEALVADADPGRFVLTHGEPHPGNTVVTGSGVALVDWDTCLLAPPERDVWRLVREEPGILRAYADGTGVGLDGALLEAYRLRWELADVDSCVRELRSAHVDDEDTRTAWQALDGVLGRGQPNG